jgi:hypothetical protein
LCTQAPNKAVEGASVTLAPDLFVAYRDTGYGRHCEPTAAQIGGITVGTIVGISGIVTWGVSR